MKATDSYKKLNNSPLKGIILFYTNKIIDKNLEVCLGAVADKIQTGKTPPKAFNKYYETEDINWFKPSDIGFDKYLIQAREKFSQIAVAERKATIYPANTMLIIGIGGGVGRVALLAEEGSSNQQITGITFKEGICPEYAYYYYLVREDYIKSQAKSMSFPILNQSKIKELKFKAPIMEEQKKFIIFIDYCWDCFQKGEKPQFEIFDIEEELKEYSSKQFQAINLDSVIKNEIQTQKTLLTQLKQAILQEAIQGKLTEEWRANNLDLISGENAAAALLNNIKAKKARLVKAGKIKKEKPLPPITEEENPFDLPEYWVWCRLGEILKTTSGGTPSRNNRSFWNGEISWYKSGELNDGILNSPSKEFITDKGLKGSSATLFPKGTLLIAMYGATAGKLAILDSEAATNQAVCGFFRNEQVSIEYLFFYLRANRKRMINDSWGMSQPNISQTYLRDFVFALPSFEEQNAIAEKVETLMKRCTALEQEIIQSEQHAQMLMQAVLKEAFEGGKKLEAV